MAVCETLAGGALGNVAAHGSATPRGLQRRARALSCNKLSQTTPPTPSPNGTGLTIRGQDGLQPDTGAPFPVKTIQITGNTQFNSAELHPLVAAGEGKSLTLSQLRELAARISDYYHAHGFPLAQAIIPAQTIQDGGGDD